MGTDYSSGLHGTDSGSVMLLGDDRRFRSIFESIPIGMHLYRLEPGGRLIFIGANPAADAILGIDNSRFLGMTIEEAFPPLAGTELPDAYRRVASLGGKWSAPEIVFTHGAVKGVFEVTAFQISPGEMAAAFTEISARRQAEEKYRMVVENANDAIFIAQDGLIKFPNPRLSVLTGYSADELTRIPFVNFVHPSDRDVVVQRHIQRLRGLDVPATYVFRALTRSGETRWVEVTSILISWEGRPASLAFLRDITDQKRLEAQLFQAQKMEAVGQLAGGIAHDFNNFLTAIIGYSNLSLMRKPGDDPTRVFTEQILSAAEKAAQLTQNLLAFGRKQVLSVQPVDVNNVVAKVGKLLLRLIGEDVELRTRLSRDPAVTVADAGQLEQVLMNLATNARDAMPKGGSLLIATGVTVWTPQFVRVQGYGTPGRYVTIEVTDTGHGMDHQTRQRIFEPFFTTKEVGKGTGLGLSMVYGIVKQLGGYVNVESSPGRGSTFMLYFPYCVQETEQAAAAPSSGRPAGGTETILLAEDEAEVRQVLRNVLQEFGYRVIEAANGEEASLKFRDLHREIDLVISDMVMPRKNGLELCEDIGKVRPDIKVLFISGYPAGTFGGPIDDPRISYADKPLSPLALLTKVRSILEN